MEPPGRNPGGWGGHRKESGMSSRHPGDIQMHPGDTQVTPRRHPKETPRGSEPDKLENAHSCKYLLQI